MNRKLKILFLCIANASRSQMAEGWARHLKGEVMDAYSAGVNPRGLNPLAVKVMAEVGVDISRQRSKHVNEVKDVPFDYVVTLCDEAREACPVLAVDGAATVHVGFDDPHALARDAGSEQEKLAVYRQVRDDIRDFIDSLPAALEFAGRSAGSRG